MLKSGAAFTKVLDGSIFQKGEISQTRKPTTPRENAPYNYPLTLIPPSETTDYAQTRTRQQEQGSRVKKGNVLLRRHHFAFSNAKNANDS